MSKKDYLGLALDNEELKVADVQFHNRKLKLRKVVRTTFANNKGKKKKEKSVRKEEKKEVVTIDADALFGIAESPSPILNGNGNGKIEDHSSDLIDEVDILSMTDDLDDIDDITDDEEELGGNESVLFHVLSGFNSKQVQLGLNILSGSALLQILKDEQFSTLKPKQVKEIVEEKLHSIYDKVKPKEHYAYDIQKDGSLLLISIENNPDLLELIDKGRVLYPGKVFVNKMLPDEIALSGMVRANYELVENEVTGIIQFGVKSTRLIFMEGDQITAVSPIISEDIHSSGILNTVFSKILLQLDSGILPSLDRIILANNMLGDHSIEFLSSSFPDIPVEEFQFNPDKFEISEELETDVASYTSAIAMAWAASGVDAKYFDPFDFVPEYVKERQKVFKLEWHGVVLLCLLALTPIVIDHFYEIKKEKIQKLHSEIERTDNVINQIYSTVIGTQYLESQYEITEKKLDFLQKASKNSYRWSTILNMLNNSTNNVNGVWITSMRTVANGIAIDGFSLHRSQISRFASMFDDVILQNVIIQKIRDHQINKFTMVVKKVVSNPNAYSPQ